MLNKKELKFSHNLRYAEKKNLLKTKAPCAINPLKKILKD